MTSTADDFTPYRRSVDTEIGPISYLDVGEGPVTLFVHGVFTNSLLWRNCIDALSPRRRCVAIDLPGHGATPPIEQASVWGLADAVNLLIEALDLTDIHLVANDTGGAAAQVVIARAPHRFASLALTNCDTEGNFPPLVFKPVVALSRVGLLRVFRLGLAAPRLAREAFRVGYQKPGELPQDVLAGYLKPVVGTRQGRRFMKRLLTSMRSDQLAAIRTELSRLRVPTLIVWGTGDKIFGTKWAHRLRRLIPGATDVVLLPGGRLYFVDERAAEFVTELDKHWAK